MVKNVVWPELKPYSFKLFWVIVFGVLMSALKSAAAPMLNMLMTAWTNHDQKMIYLLPPIMCGVWIVGQFLRYFHMYWMLLIAELIALNFRRKLMNKYLTLNLAFYQSLERGSGGLISRMLNDISVIQGGFSRISDVVREPFTVIFTISYLLWLNWKLTLILVAGGPPIAMVLRKFAKSVRKYSHHNQESMEDLTQTLKESLDGTRIVQSFNLQDELRQRFEDQAQNFLKSKERIISREEASGPVSEALSSAIMALLFTYMGYLVLHTEFQVGDFVSFAASVGLIADATRKVQGAYIKVQQSSVALERLQTILTEGRVVPEIASPKPFPNDWQEIEFRDVSFRYETHDVLRNVNLKIKRGEQVALVGSSGAGKSTLINLLPRFFDPTSGHIYIGGVSIHDMKLSDLRSNVALVTQDVFLFSDSVHRNIWSGDFSKPDGEVIEAARLANADDFIKQVPKGYETMMGERGARFSGGEKQRISIARAIFKDAPILILDEATSALDSESEFEVQKGLDKLMQGRTALIIAHRLSTISKCSRILVMDQGQVIEEGSHNELMVQKGAYYRFFQLQSRL